MGFHQCFRLRMATLVYRTASEPALALHHLQGLHHARGADGLREKSGFRARTMGQQLGKGSDTLGRLEMLEPSRDENSSYSESDRTGLSQKREGWN